MGLIFTKGDLKEVSEEVAKYKVRLSDALDQVKFTLISASLHGYVP